VALNILLIEDNSADVFLVRRALREHSLEHSLTVARDGEQASRVVGELETDLSKPTPDVILLDLNLPRLDGHELLQRIRGSSRIGEVPVVVVTSSDSPRDRSVAAEYGATSYFRKPSDLDEFMKLGALVKSVLDGMRT
jgi:CheY-like chemotaxis protein